MTHEIQTKIQLKQKKKRQISYKKILATIVYKVLDICEVNLSFITFILHQKCLPENHLATLQKHNKNSN